jgi:hypothetical protein
MEAEVAAPEAAVEGEAVTEPELIRKAKADEGEDAEDEKK